MMLYTKDSATDPRIQAGFVEHDELDISDEELARLKGRARKAVSMDEQPQSPERVLPAEYEQFLGKRQTSYSDFLAGKV